MNNENLFFIAFWILEKELWNLMDIVRMMNNYKDKYCQPSKF